MQWWHGAFTGLVTMARDLATTEIMSSEFLENLKNYNLKATVGRIEKKADLVQSSSSTKPLSAASLSLILPF